MGRLLNLICVASSIRNSSTSAGLIGPAVRLLLHHYELEASSVKASGPKNNLLKSDLLLFINQGRLTPKAVIPLSKSSPVLGEISTPPRPVTQGKSEKPQNYIDIPLSNMRLTIAKRLSSSKSTIPHSYQSTNVCANNLLALRKKFLRDGFKISVNDLIIKAAALALRSVPQLNVQWKNEKIARVPTIDVSVAAATPNGLITPIIFNADQLNVEEISTRLREMAGRARENKLKPNEFQGGSFTISNLGMFGVSKFTAIINPPQTAILAVGGVRMELNEFDTPENIFEVTLCFDARAITDLDAQQFLRILKMLLTEPETMIAGPEKFDVYENIDNF